MADETYTSWISTLFTTPVYTVTQDGGTPDAYYTDATYSVELSADYYVVSEDGIKTTTLPLALLFCLYQLAFSDVAACKAEAYMAKIEGNQELQTTAGAAIADVEVLRETIPTDVDSYVTANSEWTTTSALATSDFSVESDFDATPSVVDDDMILTAIQSMCNSANISAVDNIVVTYGSVSGDIEYYGGDYIEDSLPAEANLTCNATITSTSDYTVTLTGLTSGGDIAEYTLTFTGTRTQETTCTSTEYTHTAGVYFWETGVITDTGYSTTAGDTSEPTESTSIYVATLTDDDDILKACELAGIDDIDGVTIEEGAKLTDAQLTILSEELELAQENASSTTQTDMVYAEEYLGQYNSYLSGGSSTLDDFNSSIMSIAGRI